MKRSILRRFCLAVLVAISLGTASSSLAGNATIDATTAAKLEEISAQMAKEHNSSFILVQALKDNLIEDGKPFEFLYVPEYIIINGKELKGKVAERYRKLVESYMKREPADQQSPILSIKGESLTLEEVLDENSVFRKGK